MHKKSVTTKALISLLVLLGLGGVGGGIPMLLDPSGISMGLPAGLLDKLPIDNFILPGLFLIVVMGLIPFVIAFGLWKQARWAWLATFAQGGTLILWICFQWIFPGRADCYSIPLSDLGHCLSRAGLAAANPARIRKC